MCSPAAARSTARRDRAIGNCCFARVRALAFPQSTDATYRNGCRNGPVPSICTTVRVGRKHRAPNLRPIASDANRAKTFRRYLRAGETHWPRVSRSGRVDFVRHSRLEGSWQIDDSPEGRRRNTGLPKQLGRTGAPLGLGAGRFLSDRALSARHHSWVLLRLSAATPVLLEGAIEHAWFQSAPRSLVASETAKRTAEGSYHSPPRMRCGAEVSIKRTRRYSP